MSDSSILPRPRSSYALLLLERCFPRELDVVSATQSFLLPEGKILEFVVLPGAINARIAVGENPSKALRLRAPLLPDEQWSVLSDLLAERAFFASQLLAGRLPLEVAEVAHSRAIPLLPESPLSFELDGEPVTEITIEVALLFQRLTEEFESDPCQFLMFRGKSPLELIAELRKRRITQTGERRRPTAITQIHYPSQSSEIESLEFFWRMRPEVTALSYTIKADELPASILKWLEPIPLSGLEDKIDFVVEEAYARVARLAQSFGLGL